MTGLRCSASRRAGELALALGHRHPDLFGAVLCASPGAGYQPPEVMPHPIPRTYLVAGTREPFFLENAQRWANATEACGVEVVMATRDGGHGDSFWRRGVSGSWWRGPLTADRQCRADVRALTTAVCKVQTKESPARASVNDRR